jgi:hypothetical protein
MVSSLTAVPPQIFNKEMQSTCGTCLLPSFFESTDMQAACLIVSLSIFFIIVFFTYVLFIFFILVRVRYVEQCEKPKEASFLHPGRSPHHQLLSLCPRIPKGQGYFFGLFMLHIKEETLTRPEKRVSLPPPNHCTPLPFAQESINPPWAPPLPHQPHRRPPRRPPPRRRPPPAEPPPRRAPAPRPPGW